MGSPSVVQRPDPEMTSTCKVLHEFVHQLPWIQWPFSRDNLPRNGIYFFCEEGEEWGHAGARPRIVRVGTHRQGNFRSRMGDHYLFTAKRMDFTQENPAPKDRSIFRKNIGRALLNRTEDPYQEIWNIDFTSRSARQSFGHRRNIEREKQIETEVTAILRERFSLTWIEVEDQDRRMGVGSLEAKLIGTLAACEMCRASPTWLGRFSPKLKIVESGLWLEQHLQEPGLTAESLTELIDHLSQTSSTRMGLNNARSQIT